MPVPTQYTIGTDFSTDEINGISGRSTVRTANLDSEFSNIAVSLNQAITNLNLIQRADGEIRDAMVKIHTLSAEVVSAFTKDINIRGAWLTATVYAIKDLVTESSNSYLCAVAHTSGTFATDLAAGKWVLIAASTTSLLAQAIARDGSNSPTANLPMSGFRHTAAGAHTASDQYIRVQETVEQKPIWCGTFSGTANALIATPSPAIVAYVAGQRFAGVCALASTDAVTVAVSGLSAQSITKKGISPLGLNDLVAGKLISFTYDGAQFQLDQPGAGFVLLSKQVITATGTWTKPKGCVAVISDLQPPGGGGGGVSGSSSNCAGAGGGGGGGRSIKLITNPGTTESVSVGSVGVGGVGANDGTAGGSVSFGAHHSATGGQGGVAMVAGSTLNINTGGAGGAGSGGDVNCPGQPGSPGIRLSAGESCAGNGGAAANGSGGGLGPIAGSSNGITPSGFGGGGSGANTDTSTSRNGGNGAPGKCDVWELGI